MNKYLYKIVSNCIYLYYIVSLMGNQEYFQLLEQKVCLNKDKLTMYFYNKSVKQLQSK